MLVALAAAVGHWPGWNAVLVQYVAGSCHPLKALLNAAETGMTCSWDFSKAEEKEQEVRAAKAARGRARQHKAERHSQRVNQHRERAATTLARLTALQPDATLEGVDQGTKDD